MDKKPLILISLDYEKVWGFENPSSNLISYLNNADSRTEYLLRALKRYRLRSNWLIVGALVNGSYYQVNSLYHIKYRSLVTKGFEGHMKIPMSFWRRLKSDENVSIGYHTFAHLHLEETYEEVFNWEEDFALWQHSCSLLPDTCVYPRNLIPSKTGIVLDKLNRTRHPSAFHKFINSTIGYQGMLPKLLRFLGWFLMVDLLCNIFWYKGEIIVGDRFIKFFRNNLILSLWQILLIRVELKICYLLRRDYHIWFHPHNLCRVDEKGLKQLERIFKVLSINIEKNRFESGIF